MLLLYLSVACGKNNNSSTSKDSTVKLTNSSYGNYEFSYYENWTQKVSDDNSFLYLYPPSGNGNEFIMLHYQTAETGGSDTFNLWLFAENMLESLNVENASVNTETQISGVTARKVVFDATIKQGEYHLETYLLANQDKGVMAVQLVTEKNSSSDFEEEFSEVLYSLKLVK